MADTHAPPAQPPGRANQTLRRIGLFALLLSVVFLVGFVPMWLRARDYAASLETTSSQLRISQIQNHLASAALDARRGDYDAARLSASAFFAGLRAELDRGDTSGYAADRRQALESLFTGRDQIIALAARSDPASGERLTEVYTTYRKTAGPQTGDTR